MQKKKLKLRHLQLTEKHRGVHEHGNIGIGDEDIGPDSRPEVAVSFPWCLGNIVVDKGMVSVARGGGLHSVTSLSSLIPQTEGHDRECLRSKIK